MSTTIHPRILARITDQRARALIVHAHERSIRAAQEKRRQRQKEYEDLMRQAWTPEPETSAEPIRKERRASKKLK